MDLRTVLRTIPATLTRPPSARSRRCACAPALGALSRYAARTQLAALCFLVATVFPSSSWAQGPPVFEITPANSTVKFDVEASVAIEGTFDKWDATLTFSSPELSTGVLDIKIQAASVDTGSGMKNGKLKGKDFFDVEHNPLITFHSTKIVQTGPDIFEVDGDFTIRGVSNPEKLTLTITGKGTGSGTIKGTMAFDRKKLRNEQRHALHQDCEPR